jgi:hypothetical protein
MSSTVVMTAPQNAEKVRDRFQSLHVAYTDIKRLKNVTRAFYPELAAHDVELTERWYRDCKGRLSPQG